MRARRVMLLMLYTQILVLYAQSLVLGYDGAKSTAGWKEFGQMSEVEPMDEVGRLGGWGTFALGVGAAVMARVLAPVLARRGRPLARGAVRQAIIVAEGARVRAAGLREDWQDLVAEARADLRRETGAAGQ